jgi:hypothetical protein
MFSFQPEEQKAVAVPFYEDAKEKDGWQGQATAKSVNKLQDEIAQAINRLGGIVSGFQRGVFQIGDQKREGFQIHYHLKAPNGQLVPGRLDVAALPVRDRWSDAKKDKSLRMALYMVREGLEGMWLMQQLSPGYAALMPFILTDENKTVSQLWSETPVMNRLLPPGESEFIEAEVKED